jgi:hypothetical protein
VLIFLFYTRDLQHLARWHPAAGVGSFLVLSVPWLIAAWRTAASRGPYLSSAHNPPKMPVLFFWALLLVWMVPWCLFSLAALGRVSGRLFSRSAELDHGEQSLLLLVLWAALVMVLYTFSSRREFFVLPALPALSLLAAGWLESDEATPSRFGLILAWIFFVAGIIKACIAVFLAWHIPAPAPGTDIATLLDLQRGQLHGQFGQFRDLTFAAMGAFRTPLLIAAIAAVAGVTANLVFRLKGNARAANCFLAGMMVVVLVAVHLALNIFSPVVSSAILAEAIKPEAGPSDVIVVNGRYEDASALGFYLERPVKLLNAPASALASWSLAPNAPAIFVDDASLAKLWDSETRVFLWTSAGNVPSLPSQAYVVGRDGGREIVSNQPNNSGAAF